mgnify:FL=1
MSAETYEEIDWNELSSGLPDDMDGTITEPIFKFDSEYTNNEGEHPLLLVFTLVDISGEQEPNVMKCSMGKGWEPVDNGRGIRRADGKPANFNGSSAVGLILKELRDHDVNINEVVQAQGAIPTTVDFWDGLTCSWKRKTIKYGGEIGDKEKLLPTGLLGTKQSTAKPKPAASAAKKAAPKAEAASKPVAKKAAAKKAVAAAPEPEPEPEPEVAATEAGDFGGFGIDAVLANSIYDIAMQSDDEDAFKTACYEQIPEATTDADVMAAIEDTGDGSIWAQAVADYEASQA